MLLGKQPAKQDVRNLMLRTILRADRPAIPAAFDVDEFLVGGHLNNHMFLNDQLGCCVIAGRAHHTIRLELKEQGGVVGIQDAEVKKEYFLESGGKDEGLEVLPSLNKWRQDGWLLGWTTFKIDAFAEIRHQDHDAIKTAICNLMGVGLGLGLPITAQRQLDNGEPWTKTGTSGSASPYSWGGHYVYVVGYNETGPVCITWGQRQQMSWDFVDFYADECYSVIDATTPVYNVVDRAKVANFLKTL